MEAVKIVKERSRLLRSSFFVEQDVKLTQASRILSVTADVQPTGEECVAGEIRVTGRLEYKILFLREDGALDCAIATKDFLEKITDKNLTPTSHAVIDIEAVETEYSGTEIVRIRTTVEICGWFVAEKEICTMLPAESPDVLCKIKTAEIETVSVLPSSLKEVSKELELVGGADRVLCAQTKITVNSVACATEIAYIDAEMTATVLYSKDNNLFQETVIAPFTAELVSAEITADSPVMASGQVVSATVSIADEKTLLIEASVLIKGSISKVEEYEYVQDAYSIKYETENESATFSIARTACKEVLSDKLNGSLRIEAENGSIRTIIGATEPVVAGLALRVEDSRTLVAEGVMSVRVLYLDVQGAPYTALLEAPFQFSGARECAFAEVLYAKATVHNFSARIRLGDEIEFSATLEVAVEGTVAAELTTIKSCKMLAERETDDAAISLYIVSEGETTWDVAKSLLTDESSILAQNPDLHLPLQGGEHVVSYKEL